MVVGTRMANPRARAAPSLSPAGSPEKCAANQLRERAPLPGPSLLRLLLFRRLWLRRRPSLIHDALRSAITTADNPAFRFLPLVHDGQRVIRHALRVQLPCDFRFQVFARFDLCRRTEGCAKNNRDGDPEFHAGSSLLTRR